MSKKRTTKRSKKGAQRKPQRQDGLVYILSNPSFKDNLLKIGQTSRTAQERAWEIYTGATGVPRPFEVEYTFHSSNCVLAEKKVHFKLDKYRVNQGREFFNVPVDEAVSVISNIVEDINKRTVLPPDTYSVVTRDDHGNKEILDVQRLPPRNKTWAFDYAGAGKVRAKKTVNPINRPSQVIIDDAVINKNYSIDQPQCVNQKQPVFDKAGSNIPKSESTIKRKKTSRKIDFFGLFSILFGLVYIYTLCFISEFIDILLSLGLPKFISGFGGFMAIVFWPFWAMSIFGFFKKRTE